MVCSIVNTRLPVSLVIDTARIVCGTGSVERSSIRLSACPSAHRSTTGAACGGFAADRPAGRRHRSIAGAGAQQQRRHSTAFGSKCGQCHVDSRVGEAEDRLVIMETLFMLVTQCLCGDNRSG